MGAALSPMTIHFPGMSISAISDRLWGEGCHYGQHGKIG